MPSRRPTTALLAVLTAALLAACSGSARSPASAAATGARTSSPGDTSPAFSGMRAVLLRGTAPREANDARALRSLGPSISRSGLALLQARMPHDLRRSYVEHFLEARAAFGDALKLWVAAVEGADDGPVLGAYDEVVNAYWAWVDVYRGRAPERAV